MYPYIKVLRVFNFYLIAFNKRYCSLSFLTQQIAAIKENKASASVFVRIEKSYLVNLSVACTNDTILILLKFLGSIVYDTKRSNSNDALTIQFTTI